MPGWGFWMFLAVSLATLAAAVGFALRPTEHRLTVLRPMCAAATFATVASFCLGMTNALTALSLFLGHATDAVTMFPMWPRVVRGIAEALMGLVLGSTLLTISWLLVAVGLRRQA